MLRTHTCGELNKKLKGKEVVLCGWVDTIRTHGKINFLNIRDRYGYTQVVLNEDLTNIAKDLKNEFVIKVTGIVKERPDKLVKKDWATGEIELHAKSVEILNESDPLPIDISGKITSSDETRLKYRYLDLRQHKNQHFLKIRHKAMKAVMNYLDSENFYHITTPMLVKSTPEGARDYVVPSRINKGKFYALPQSPQLYKQILMVAGFDRYFQFAICLRDEDLRADRQPEHMQIDLEMSFVEKEDVFRIVEGIMKSIWKETIDVDIKAPFKVISHSDARNKYGSDKPDIRFKLELNDVTKLFEKTNFTVFQSVIGKGDVIKALVIPKGGEFSKKEIKKYEELVKIHHAKGLVDIKITDKGLEGPAVKFFSEEEIVALERELKAKQGDLILIVADKLKVACEALGQARLKAANDLDLIPKDKWEFVWVTDFPLFEYNNDQKKWEPEHHPFCMPKKEHIKFLETGELGKIYCEQYDLSLNGWELLSGSIRINRPDIQEKVFKAIGLSQETAQVKFGFLLDAFKYGAPPHAGAGLGFDRIISMICGSTDIRDVIAFPKNKNAQCPMDSSPSKISDEQMEELGIFHYME